MNLSTLIVGYCSDPYSNEKMNKSIKEEMINLDTVFKNINKIFLIFILLSITCGQYVINSYHIIFLFLNSYYY